MIDIDALEALANDAGSLPWSTEGDIICEEFPCESEAIARVVASHPNCDGIASFIAAANPAAICELIAEVRALREDAERYRWLRDEALQGRRDAPLGVAISILDESHNHCGWAVTYDIDADAAIDAARGSK
jgi:hypothetical protein